jgi:putative SOS response-associated peptidase YedK
MRQIQLIFISENVRKRFNLSITLEFRVDYNITPGRDILAIMPEAKTEFLHWGLIPFLGKRSKDELHPNPDKPEPRR